MASTSVDMCAENHGHKHYEAEARPHIVKTTTFLRFNVLVVFPSVMEPLPLVGSRLTKILSKCTQVDTTSSVYVVAK